MRIRCLSATSWVPDPAEESMDRAELEAMLRRLARAFAASVTAIDPRYGRFEPVRSWSRV